MTDNILFETVLTFIGALGAYLGYLAQKHAKEANKAVNGNKDPEAARLYDLVVNVDQRTDRLETWMIKHKGETLTNTESIEKHDVDIAGIKTSLSDIERKIDQVDVKISEYGCPVRLGITDKPICEKS